MDNPISSLNKLFDSRIRLGVMSVLAVNDSVGFAALKQLLELTDGNLATHLRALEAAGLVHATKQFVGRKPNTSYAITREGRQAFQAHLDALLALVEQSSGETIPVDRTPSRKFRPRFHWRIS